MSSKTPIRTVFNDSNVATGLAEFQTGEFIPLSHGGIGASLSIGGAGQVLKVNSGGTALEFGAVEAIVNIDGATDLESATLVAGDKILISDGGTEGRVLLSQLDTLFSGTSKTLTNKTIALGSNTVSGTLAQFQTAVTDATLVDLDDTQTLTNKTLTTPIISSISNSGTITLPTSTDTLVGRATTDTLTNKTISGASNTLSNIGNSSLSNSAVTVGTTSISLGASSTTIAGVTDFTAGSINIAGNVIKSNDSTVVEIGGGDGLSVAGNMTVTGNLTVSGSTTTVSSTNTTLADQFIELGTGRSGSASGDSGIVIERGSDTNAFIGFDESADKFIVGTGSFTGSSTGNLTISTGTLVATLEGNVTGDVSGNADTATALETARTIAGQSFDGTANITIASTDLSNTSSITLNTASQTLTNKTISGGSNTLSNIANSSLTNSSVNFGGVTLSLGASDATPAFDLSDATSYPTSSLSGTITNAQLAGSIAADKLAGSIGDSLLSTITTAGKVDVGALEIDGATDIGADLVDADLLIVDDGANGTERKSTFTRVKKFIYSAMSGDATASDSGALTIASDAVEQSMIADDAVGADQLAANAVVNASVASGAAIDAAKIHNGTISNTEFGHLNGVSDNIQTQLDTKASNAFAIAQAVALG